MRLQVKQRVLSIVLVSVMLVAVVYLADNTFRCKSSGATREEAITVADWKISVQFRTSTITERFVMESATFDDFDKSWVVTYHSGACRVAVVIDACGKADIGGLSGGCL